MTDLAIIIVSYNVRDLLADALRSLAKSLEGSGLLTRVIVVENDSHDDSAEMVRTHFPEVELLEPGKNLGFAGGNNLALRHLGFGSPSDSLSYPSDSMSYPRAPQIRCHNSMSYPLTPSDSMSYPFAVWLLNCDTLVVEDAPLRLLEHLRQNPSVAAVGPKLRYKSGSHQHAAFAFPGLSQLVLDLFPAPGRLQESWLNGRYSCELWEGQKAFPVQMLLGAALMVRGAAIEQVGLMDEGYFMYAEELDWCRSFHEAGWLLHALPTATVIHYGGQSTQQFRDRMFVALWRSRLRYYEKWESASYVRLVRLLLRMGMRWQSWQAQKRKDSELERRLSTYREVAAL